MIIGLSWEIFIGNLRFVWFDFELFRAWSWPLNVTGHLKSEIFLSFESPYNITSIDTFSPSRVIYDIFWLRRFQGLTLMFDLWRSPEIKNMFANWKPIHDFLSNADWLFLSISYRFSDIWLQNFPEFDLNLWPSEDTSGLTFFCHSKSHTWLLIYVLLTLSLYRSVFEIFEFKKSRVRPWPLNSRRCQIYFCISKAHNDFLSNVHLNFLSISYRF